MIVFEGENSNECKVKVIKRNSRILLIIYLLLFLITFPTSLIFYLQNTNQDYALRFLLISILFLPMSILIAKMPVKNVKKVVWKTKVEINNEKIILVRYINSLNTLKQEFELSLIKKIVDDELYYTIIVKNIRIICEKSLIINGTLSEFESKFNDKIIRKKDKNEYY